MDIKKIVDGIILIWKIIRYIVPIVLGIILYISNNYHFLFTKINFQLPIWAIILVFGLTLYPFIKLLERIIKGKRKLIKLNGLLWESRLLPFLPPRPKCQVEGCGLDIICVSRKPKYIQIIDSVNALKNIDTYLHYAYECPVHGKQNVPDESIGILTEKAKSALKKGRNKRN